MTSKAAVKRRRAQNAAAADSRMKKAAAGRAGRGTSAGGPGPTPPPHTARRSWITRHKYPLWGLGAALAAFFVWVLVIDQAAYGSWRAPVDVWSAAQGAQFDAHGWFDGIYRAMQVPEFPLWPLVLAPVRALCGLLGLSGGYNWYEWVYGAPNHPTAWLVYGPVSVLGAGLVLFAGDSLAGALGVTNRRRVMLIAGLALLVLYDVVYYGHPEDLLATALLLYALGALHDGRPGLAGWLAGAAVSTNPVVVLALPVLLAQLSSRTWRRFGLRLFALPVLVLAPPFMTDPRATWNALGLQPNFTNIHPTPLVDLARHVGAGVVYAGPVRLVAVVIVMVGAFILARRRSTLQWALFVCGVALLARQLIEPVMVPYYLVPGIAALSVVMLARRTTPWALTGVVGAVAAVGAASQSISPWPYLLLVAATSAVCVWGAWPATQPGVGDAPAPEPKEQPWRPARSALIGACVLLVVAGTTLYSRATPRAQTAVLTANWDSGPGTNTNPPYGIPPVKSLFDRVYVLKGTQVVQEPTLAPFSYGVTSSVAAQVRTWASTAESTARRWENLAWVAPSRTVSNASQPPSHVLAAAWISALGATGAPGMSEWKAGPRFCLSDTDYTQATLGAPDYRIVMWSGCGSSSVWLDADPQVRLQAGLPSVGIGLPVDETFVVADPTGTKLLSAYVGWGITAAVHVASSNTQPYTRTVLAKGIMELRPGSSGLRIWDPWWWWSLSLKSS